MGGEMAETFGPVQLLILGFEDPKFKGEILEELERLKEADIVRVIDAVAFRKDKEGHVEMLHRTDLSEEEAKQFGAVVGALIGLGYEGEEGLEAGAKAGADMVHEGHIIDEENAWYVADHIPDGQAAAAALIEHRWAIPLRDAIARAGGVALVDAWIHPKDLVAAGLKAAEETEAAKA
jgi:uncharacterized membrane protein